MSETRKKVAIIGGGFGGLSTAIRLQAAGFDVTILEKRDKLGGRAYVYQDQGFTFDAGPTVITAPECLEELFQEAGRKLSDYVELLPVTPLYRLCWEDGFTFDYTNDLEDTLKQIKKVAPGDVEGYKKFLKYTEEVFEEGYTKLAHVPFLNWGSMLRVAPQLMRLQAFRSVYSMVSKYLKDPHLRQAFSFHSLLVGGNPFRTSSIYTLIHFLERKWGVYFPRGGTGALVKAMGKLFEELGGKIVLNAPVERIVTESARVQGVRYRGQFQAFDIVVSNADVARTYLDLLPEEPAAEASRQKLARADYSMSLFVLYFGTKKQYPHVAHHNVLFCSRYKELLKDIFTRGKLADDFSLYLHAPSHSDRSVAPPGGEAFYVLSPVPHLGKGDIDWQVEGPRYADRILNYLEQRYLPGLRESIVTQRFFTPADFQSELQAHLGSAFSLEPVLTQSAYWRVHNRDPKIANLYFVGAGTHPGAGVPGVVNSAKATAGLVLADHQPQHRTVAPLVPAPIPVTGLTPGLKIDQALVQCREMIRVGSKSFSLAAKLFAPSVRDAACFLYGWCRFCDDSVDRIDDPAAQAQRVSELREQTRRAFAGEAGENPVFVAMHFLAQRYQIPPHYALELIEGMAMDVRAERYRTIDELALYCYRVASTVGLMMSHVMGVSDAGALRNAADLGTAMQLTNIARDVHEDAGMGRVYLPLDWLAEAGVPPEAVTDPRYRRQIAQVVARLLEHAQSYYESGVRGLAYLPFRCACAVAAAAYVYREIGRQVLARGEAAWDTRTVVSKPRKIWALVCGIGLALRTVPTRVFRPFRPAALPAVHLFIAKEQQT